MKTILVSLIVAASAALLQAQPEGGNPPGGPRPGGPGGPGAPGAPGGPEGRRPTPPLMAALDANKDGEISAEEMANAATALKALDKNNDGKISREELRPSMPPRGEGNGQGEGRPPRDGRPRPEGAAVPPVENHLHLHGAPHFAGQRPAAGTWHFHPANPPQGQPAFDRKNARDHRRGPSPAERQ